MKTKSRGCVCSCDIYEICVCECSCKSHRETHLDKEFWEKQEKKKLFFQKLKNKKEKQELEIDIDKLLWGE